MIELDADVNAPNKRIGYALFYCYVLPTARLLLSTCVIVNQRNSYEEIAMHHFVHSEDDSEILKAIMETGVDFTIKDHMFGETPREVTVKFGRKTFLKIIKAY